MKIVAVAKEYRHAGDVFDVPPLGRDINSQKIFQNNTLFKFPSADLVAAIPQITVKQ